MVLEEGVLEGRKVFVNILKYIRMGASSNFGNMFSVIGASAWLPYVPMAPIQVLTNNLLYDFSQVPIPTDNVGPQQTSRPRPWNMDEIAKFIVCIGPISSIFDYTTYAIMWFVFKCNNVLITPELITRYGKDAVHYTYAAQLFHTGWFVESLMTQTLIIHVIRTNKTPLIESRASLALTVSTLAVCIIGIWLPYSPIAADLGFTPLPLVFWLALLAIVGLYLFCAQMVKSWLFKTYAAKPA
jgi:P-type Mg2+ transporter